MINAAATDSPLDLSLAAQPLASKLAFATSSDYRDVPGGAGTLTVTGGSGTPTDLPVELAAGSVYTVLVLDRDNGGLTVTTALDAASPGVVPRGGVEAGAGGTAVDPGLPPGRTAPVAWGTVVVLTLTGALALAGALRLTTVLLPVGARRSRGRRPTRHQAP